MNSLQSTDNVPDNLRYFVIFYAASYQRDLITGNIPMIHQGFPSRQQMTNVIIAANTFGKEVTIKGWQELNCEDFMSFIDGLEGEIPSVH